MQPVLDQFFVALEVSDVQTFLCELDMTMFHHEFAKKAITLSFAQANPEPARESVIQLFNHLTSVNVLSKDRSLAYVPYALSTIVIISLW